VDSSERYRIETCSRTWPGCSKAPESIGFLNKTCTAGTFTSDFYGDTVGPLLRGSGVSSKWRTWIVDVVSKGADSSTVTIKNDFWAARCTNKYIDDYSDTKGACKGTEWSERVRMHVYRRKWTVRPVEGVDSGCYNIIQSEKAAGCTRYLSASSDCKDPYLSLAEKDDGSGLQQWRFVKVSGRGDSPPQNPTPAPTPAPAPAPTPAPALAPAPASPPPPPAPIPGPTIQPYVYGQTIVSSGFIELSVTSFGGNDRCSVDSIVFTSVARATGVSTSTPAYMIDKLRVFPATVRLISGSEYEVYAQGACSSGATTERSNVLTVQSVMYPYTSATPPTISSANYNFPGGPTSVTWTPGKNSDPPARDPAFFVTCVPSGTPCPSSPAYDVSRPPGTITTVVGPAPQGVCYVVAKNYNGQGVCSEPVASCFPGDSIVITPTGKKSISRLEVGDKVLTVSRTGSLLFEEIYLLGHKDSRSVGLFVQIHTDNNATLRLTRDHQIPFTSQVDKATTYGPAAGVRVGHYVRVVSDGSTAVSLSRVTAVEEVFAQGYFNPYTMGGNIVVDGVVASCHSSFVLDKLFDRVGISIPAGYQAVFGPLRVIFKAVGAKSFQNIQFLVDGIVEMVNHPHLPWTQIVRNGFCSGKG